MEPPPPSKHGRDGVPRPQKDAGGVDLHDRTPAVERERIELRRGAQAGVVHEDVQPAEGGAGGGQQPFPVALLRHVRVDELGVAAGFLNAAGNGLAPLIPGVGDDDLGPLLGEQFGIRGPQAAARFQ